MNFFVYVAVPPRSAAPVGAQLTALCFSDEDGGWGGGSRDGSCGAVRGVGWGGGGVSSVYPFRLGLPSPPYPPVPPPQASFSFLPSTSPPAPPPPVSPGHLPPPSLLLLGTCASTRGGAGGHGHHDRVV